MVTGTSKPPSGIPESIMDVTRAVVLKPVEYMFSKPIGLIGALIHSTGSAFFRLFMGKSRRKDDAGR